MFIMWVRNRCKNELFFLHSSTHFMHINKKGLSNKMWLRKTMKNSRGEICGLVGYIHNINASYSGTILSYYYSKKYN